MDLTGTLPLREVDRLVELTSIGAGHAAGALAALVGEPQWMTVPAASPIRSGQREASPAGSQALADPVTGIFFEIHGALAGEVAVLIPGDARNEILASLLGANAPTSDAVERGSALQELGNILVSHVVSAMADTVGGVILPSAPSLALQNAAENLERRLAEREAQGGCLRLETCIVDAQGHARAVLVFLPELPGA